jgi:pimeloyl-ACP methyl ester carboxylesterase
MALHLHAAALLLALAPSMGCAAAVPPPAASAPPTSPVATRVAPDRDNPRVQHRWAVVNGIKIFYREVTNPGKPVLLLLHGFPSSSHMYRELLPLLAKDFHLVAPDYPGAGFSEHPTADRFVPSFANLADLMSAFVQQIGLSRFTIYMQDFGGPVGFRMAVAHPERVAGLVIQNANAYLEGIAPDQLKGIMAPQREQAAQLVSREFTLFMYKTGARDFESMDPTGWQVDTWILEQPDARRIQTELMLDYRSNVLAYPRWQAYLRTAQPETLIVWGRNDPIFRPAGAHAYRRDLPKAKLHFYATGHFALEEEAPAIAREIRRAFARE